MVEVSHHLPDELLRSSLGEIARVTRDRFLFIDAVRGIRLRTKVLWQLDLGRHPRSETELIAVLAEHFDVVDASNFRGSHDHLLCLCVPRRHS
jgi:hypothetical protein